MRKLICLAISALALLLGTGPGILGGVSPAGPAGSFDVDEPRKDTVADPDREGGRIWRLPAEYDFQKNWNLEMLDIRHVWPQEMSSGVVVAVIDTGVDIVHSDLNKNIWTYEDQQGSHNGKSFVDPYNKFADPLDEIGHGTHMAGIIAAVANGEGTVGVNHRAQIMPIRVIKGKYIKSVDDVNKLIDGIDWATEHGAEVINCSLGFRIKAITNDEQEQDKILSKLRETLEKAGRMGVVVVAAAGNEAMDLDRRQFYPANFAEELPNVISVTAIDSSGHPYHSANRGFRTIDIAAPGKDIWSTWPIGNYKVDGGTSQAAAHVSGAVSLLLARNRKHFSRDTQGARKIKETIIENALPSSNFGVKLIVRDGRQLNLGFLAGFQGLTPRVPYKDERIVLTPHFGASFLKTPPPDPKMGDKAKFAMKMAKWKEWMAKGASKNSPTDQLLVYEAAGGAFRHHYITYETVALHFPKNPKARLAEGVAFLWHEDPVTGDPIYRQIEFMANERNMSQEPPALASSIKNLTINSGDSLLVVLRFTAKGAEPLPTMLDDYAAELELVRPGS